MRLSEERLVQIGQSEAHQLKPAPSQHSNGQNNPGTNRLQGNGIGGGAAASSRTRSITDSRKPDDGISTSSVERM